VLGSLWYADGLWVINWMNSSQFIVLLPETRLIFDLNFMHLLLPPFHACTWVGGWGVTEVIPPAEWVKMRENERFLTIFRWFSAIFVPADPPPTAPENFCSTCMVTSMIHRCNHVVQQVTSTLLFVPSPCLILRKINFCLHNQKAKILYTKQQNNRWSIFF